MNGLNIYKQTKDVLSDVKYIIDASQKQAYQAVNTALVLRNWYIGKRIYEEELNGENRAEYGAEVIKKLSKELQKEYGKGYTKSNLYNFYLFYKMYPNIFQSVIGKFNLLSWTHYLTLLQVKDTKIRNWYEQEAYNESWSYKRR